MKVLQRNLKSSETKLNSPKLLECSIVIKKCFKRGILVWGKLKAFGWWPGVVISTDDCGIPKEDVKKHHFWIYYFGDHKISQIPAEYVQDFVSKFALMDRNCTKQRYKLAMYEVLREASIRMHPEIANEHYRSLVSWADSGFHPRKNLKTTYTLSDRIVYHLKRIKGNFIRIAKKIEERKSLTAIKRLGNASKRVRRGDSSFLEMCIACDNASSKIIDEHPLFNGGLCHECLPIVNHVANNLPLGKFSGLCIICGQGGCLVICSLNRCFRAFCQPCIECLVSPEAYKVVLKTRPWICYLCKPHESKEHGLIWKKTTTERQECWKMSICPSTKSFTCKKAIKVVSFDDTGKIILDKLKISIGKYYILCPFGKLNLSTDASNIEFVGNIQMVDNSRIDFLLPIDLIIGFTLKTTLEIKQKYKGTSEIGLMFYQFYRVLTHIEQKALAKGKQSNVFWIFISEVTMTSKYKEVACRFLNCDPFIMTIRLNQAYYVWTNLPNAINIASKISDMANKSIYTPVTLEPDMAQKDEEDTLEAFLISIKNYFQSTEL